MSILRDIKNNMVHVHVNRKTENTTCSMPILTNVKHAMLHVSPYNVKYDMQHANPNKRKIRHAVCQSEEAKYCMYATCQFKR